MGGLKEELVRALADLRTVVNGLNAGPIKVKLRIASEAVIAAIDAAYGLPLRDGYELPRKTDYPPQQAA